jgi:hypothetical protein
MSRDTSPTIHSSSFAYAQANRSVWGLTVKRQVFSAEPVAGSNRSTTYRSSSPS